MDSAGMQACLRLDICIGRTPSSEKERSGIELGHGGKGRTHRAYALQREGAKRNRAGAWRGTACTSS